MGALFYGTLAQRSVADTVFSDFGAPASLYQCCESEDAIGGGFASAAALTPSAAYKLTQIDLALGYDAGTNDFHPASVVNITLEEATTQPNGDPGGKALAT